MQVLNGNNKIAHYSYLSVVYRDWTYLHTEQEMLLVNIG